jgi:hypothetical protein
MSRDGGDGWGAWEIVPRIAGGVLAVPVVVGFVALGVVVVAARSVRGLARQTVARLPGLRSGAPPPPELPREAPAEPARLRKDARGR